MGPSKLTIFLAVPEISTVLTFSVPWWGGGRCRNCAYCHPKRKIQSLSAPMRASARFLRLYSGRWRRSASIRQTQQAHARMTQAAVLRRGKTTGSAPPSSRPRAGRRRHSPTMPGHRESAARQLTARRYHPAAPGQHARIGRRQAWPVSRLGI